MATFSSSEAAMPTSRSRSTTPKYRRQKLPGRADRAFVELNGKRIMLGLYDSPESREKYHRLVAEWEANGRPVRPAEEHSAITVEDLLAAFWAYAERYYGTSGELGKYRDALRPVRKLYGTTAANDFGPTALKALRTWTITHGTKKKWCRNYANRQIKRVVRVFRWGVENELIDAAVYQRLAAVDGLRKNRSEVVE